jgi:hypothetical protein
VGSFSIQAPDVDIIAYQRSVLDAESAGVIIPLAVCERCHASQAVRLAQAVDEDAQRIANLKNFLSMTDDDGAGAHSLTIRSLSQRGLTDAAAHALQQGDVENILVMAVKESYDAGRVTILDSCFPRPELQESTVSQANTLLWLSDQQTAGRDNVGIALQNVRGGSDGVYFAIKFQPHGQKLKKEAAAWVAAQSSSGLLNVRAIRLRADVASAKGDTSKLAKLRAIASELVIDQIRSGSGKDLGNIMAEIMSAFTTAFEHKTKEVQSQFGSMLSSLFNGESLIVGEEKYDHLISTYDSVFMVFRNFFRFPQGNKIMHLVFDRQSLPFPRKGPESVWGLGHSARCDPCRYSVRFRELHVY